MTFNAYVNSSFKIYIQSEVVDPTDSKKTIKYLHCPLACGYFTEAGIPQSKGVAKVEAHISRHQPIGPEALRIKCQYCPLIFSEQKGCNRHQTAHKEKLDFEQLRQNIANAQAMVSLFENTNNYSILNIK